MAALLLEVVVDGVDWLKQNNRQGYRSGWPCTIYMNNGVFPPNGSLPPALRALFHSPLVRLCSASTAVMLSNLFSATALVALSINSAFAKVQYGMLQSTTTWILLTNQIQVVSTLRVSILASTPAYVCLLLWTLLGTNFAQGQRRFDKD